MSPKARATCQVGDWTTILFYARRPTSAGDLSTAVQFALIVFSHLRWDFVFQRPQHLLSRLASRHAVVYIEEPLPADDDRDSWELSRPMDNVLAARPRLARLSSRSD